LFIVNSSMPTRLVPTNILFLAAYDVLAQRQAEAEVLLPLICHATLIALLDSPFLAAQSGLYL